MPDCTASGQTGTRMKRNADAGTCLVPEIHSKETQSGTGMPRYRTEMTEAGIPMPAVLLLLALRPMPTVGAQDLYMKA
jgi:hypothetical protein